jgi:peptidyl-prolyl cis-trans isomerase C
MSEEDKLLYREAVNEGISNHPDIQKMMITTLLHERVYSQVEEAEFKEAELRQFFEEHRDSFATPARVHLRRILLSPSEDHSMEHLEPSAIQVHRQVTEDTAQFSTLARKHSAGPYAPQGGDVGFLTADGKGGVATSVVDHAFAAVPGAPPVLIRTEEGWNIFWVPEATERVEPDFNTVRHTVVRRLKAARHRALYSTYIDGLKAAAESHE